jgi:hypothetical protein
MYAWQQPRIAATKTLQLATKKKGPNFKTGMTLETGDRMMYA